VAEARASAAARRKKRDKLERLATAEAVDADGIGTGAAGGAAAGAISRPRKRGASCFNITKSLTLATADEICNLAIDACTRNAFHPICICVLDAEGHTIVTKRMDGCPPLMYPKISHAKANTCVSTKSSSRAYGQKYLQRPHSNNDDDDDHDDDREVGPSTFTRVINQISTASGDLAAFPGGVLVKEKSTGVIVGSVGVSGAAGDEDEYCALEGVHGCSLARELTPVPVQHCCSTIRLS
jgi:glc operon protein GlcG